MFYKLENKVFVSLFIFPNTIFKFLDKQRSSHTGVLEFIADEGKVFLPGWMMRNLLLDEGDIITLTSTTLPGSILIL